MKKRFQLASFISSDYNHFRGRTHRVHPVCISIVGSLSLMFFIVLLSLNVYGQSSVIRGTFSGAGGHTTSEQSQVHGSLSQSAVGKMEGVTMHAAGFWRAGLLPNSTTMVKLPQVEASVGNQLTIPLLLESVTGSLVGQTRTFTARIRYNATLLEPIGVPCTRVDDTCFIELSGTATLVSGQIATMKFRAKLGNDTTTALVIEEFAWGSAGDELNQIIRVDGEFRLLGVCREGDSIRLIQSGSAAARISISPNPARERSTAQFSSSESGFTELILFDVIGNEITRLAAFVAEAEQHYWIDLELYSIPSGVYTVICKTPSETLTKQLLITQ